MKPALTPNVHAVGKAPTGILGLDEMTGGGFPVGRTTLLAGEPGSGKTLLALQFLVHGIEHEKEPGIFVAFEETSNRIMANAGGFGWNLEQLKNKTLFFVDAQPLPELVQSGTFDLSGMIAGLDARIAVAGARRIVFDALDVLLALLPDRSAQRREIYRLHEWSLARELTCIITAKTGGDDVTSLGMPNGFLQFLVDCSVILKHIVEQGVSQRNLRVQKYRGSSFDENESPFLIGASGFEVAVARSLSRVDVKVTQERVSSGIGQLDTMLEGGYYRGSSVLLTGSPGTCKTTLGGAFAQAACLRGERTLFVSFDSDGSEVIRNLAPVGIQLEPHVKSGCLRMISARTIAGSAATYLVRIKNFAQEHEARCLVIDPVSTLSNSENEFKAHSVAERLIDWAKEGGITLVCTSLPDKMAGQQESGSLLQISTLADTWIHLNYFVQAGERNRGISVVKCRGTAHSNQVRELILSSSGISLADPYTADGDVLMGTLRRQKEGATRAATMLKRISLDAEETELEGQLKSLQAALSAKQAEKVSLVHSIETSVDELLPNPVRIPKSPGSLAGKSGRK
jgi:circadian clock protein KaiC